MSHSLYASIPNISYVYNKIYAFIFFLCFMIFFFMFLFFSCLRSATSQFLPCPQEWPRVSRSYRLCLQPFMYRRVGGRNFDPWLLQRYVLWGLPQFCCVCIRLSGVFSVRFVIVCLDGWMSVSVFSCLSLTVWMNGWMVFCLSVCLSVCVSGWLYDRLSACLSVGLYVGLCVWMAGWCWSACLFVRMPGLSVRLDGWMVVGLYVCLPVSSMSVCLCAWMVVGLCLPACLPGYLAVYIISFACLFACLYIGMTF